MKGKLLGLLIAILLFTIAFSGCFEENKKTPTVKSKTIYVDINGGKNFTKIQDAINAASNGDTIYVYHGIYYENVNVTKSITLIGEDKNSTIIDAGGQHDCILVLANNTNISDFTLQNSGNKGAYVLVNKTFTNEGFLYWDSGVDIYINCSHININHNIIQNTQYAIILEGYSVFNTIQFNTFLKNNYLGIYFDYSNYNNVSNNIFHNNNQNIDLDFSEHNTLSKNLFGSTTSYHNVYFAFSSNNTLSRNIIKDSRHGIVLDDNKNNNNTIIFNKISNISEAGIYIRGVEQYTFPIEFAPKNNIIANNDILNNNCGIKSSSFNNSIYHNNFINNIQNANDTGQNTWFNQELKEGNYWFDYSGVDKNGDGIGDTSYNITGGINEDKYPLMNPVKI